MKSLNNRITKYLIFILLAGLCAVACFLNSFSSGSARAASVDDNYHFESVDFTASVNKNKSLTVCETLVVNFEHSGINTGIIRDIQRLSKSTRIIDEKFVDGSVYIATLDDVSVTFDGGECRVTQSLSDGNQFYSIKMQQPTGYISAGTHTFVFYYTYGMADDRVAGYDDLTYDVLGYAMAKTDKFTATVTFPEDADLSNVTFRTGGKTQWIPDVAMGESAAVDGNIIKITAFPEYGHQGYTIQVLMQEGYFGGRNFIWYYAVFAFFTVAAIAGIVFLFVKNRNFKRIETIEFYPPEDTTVMRFAAIWRIKSKFKDAGALILKWAGMGIVSVQNDGRHDVILKANVMNGKEFAGKKAADRLPKSDKRYFDNIEEETYFNTLFCGIGGLNFTFSSRYYKNSASHSKKRLLYDAVSEMSKEALSRPTPVKASTTKGKMAMAFLPVVPTVSMLIYNCILTQSAFMLFLVIFIVAGCVPLAFFNYNLGSGSFIAPLYVILVFPLTFYGMPLGLFFSEYYLGYYDYACLMYIAVAVWGVGSFILPRFMIKRTEEAQATYGRIRGFRNFILKAELPKIQLLFDENPFYFSDILPYCLIMGISDKVKKRFGALQIDIPEYVAQGVNMQSVCDSIGHSCSMGTPVTFSSGGGSSGSSGGGGGGSGGSSGGGGGGGGSRGC